MRPSRAVPAILPLLAAGVALAAADGDPAGPSSRVLVLADAAGRVDVHPGGGGPPEEGLVGRLLHPGDRIEVDTGVAWVYGSDGLLHTVGAGESWIVTGASGAGGDAGLPEEARVRIAYGLRTWSLGGRGTTADVGWAEPAGEIRLLSPFAEPVLDPRPDFFWTGSSEPVRIVVARDERILYRSGPVTGSFVRYPPAADALLPEVEHSWWLESLSGARLGPAGRFKVVRPELRAEVERFEAAVTQLGEDTGRTAIPNVLRCAYYASIGMWSRVLEATYDLPERRSTRRFAQEVARSTRRRLHLDSWASTYLVGLRVWKRLDI